MGIRACALECGAFRTLFDVYTHRGEAIKKLRNSGKKVVAQLGCDVPDELILAAGMVPVRLYSMEGEPGKPLDMSLADKYLEYAFDPMMRAKFQQIVDGTWYGLCDHLAISNSTDVIIRLYLYLRELRRIQPELNLPPIDFIDWLFTRHRVHQEHNEKTVLRFMDTVKTWSCCEISKEDILKAANICNENRDALRAVDGLRHGEKVRVSGSEALVIIGSAFFMERKEHTKLVQSVFKAAQQWPPMEGTRLYYTGSVQENTKLYDKIENCQCVVVGEDHDWGERFFDRDYDLKLDPVRAIADTYMLRSFSSKKAFVSQRVETLDAAVCKCNAQAVVFYNHIYEEAASWDYPEQKKSLEAMGRPTCNFSKMQWPCWENQTLDAKLSLAIKDMEVKMCGGGADHE